MVAYVLPGGEKTAKIKACCDLVRCFIPENNTSHFNLICSFQFNPLVFGSPGNEWTGKLFKEEKQKQKKGKEGTNTVYNMHTAFMC